VIVNFHTGFATPRGRYTPVLANGPAFQKVCANSLQNKPPPGQLGLKNVSTKGLALEGLLMVTDEIVQPAEDDVDRKLLKLVVVVMNPVVASDHPKSPISVPDTFKV
jgi:hypothetical protein